MKQLILLITIFVLAMSCVPQSAPKGTRNSKSSSSSTVAIPTATPTFATNESLYWYSTSKVDGTITLNSNISTVIYIRGEKIHNYLNLSSNYKKSYCLVASFATTNAKKQLRVRAVPVEINNYTSRAKERLLRIDLPSASENSTVCGGTISTYSLAADVAYAPSTICTSCASKFTTQSLKLYVADNNTSDTLPENGIADTDYLSTFALSTISIRIDPKSSTSSEVSTCTNSGCQTSGFSCCLEGQCVTNATVRPNSSTDTNYSQALADVALNPSHILNWPNIYYVCPGIPLPTPTPVPTVNEPVNGNSRFEQLKKDYLCLLDGKSGDYSSCNLSPTFSTPGVIADYNYVKVDVWERCGCVYSPTSTAIDDEACPNFGLQATLDSNDNITNVTCLTPPINAEPTPFQDTEINVTSRAVPHRLFDTAGTVVDDIYTVANSTSVTQEGTAYDPLEPTTGTGNPFNMNSILGNINVNLAEAFPAKVVNLTYGTSYIISVKSGYYTPCYSCTRDSWFDAFTAQPSASTITGLSAVGHTTTRDTYSTNTTTGNYEDTIFGRACWVPPTMIPFSHKLDVDVKTQRLNRLATQATLYSNGYMRDWYGFNKGAVIGSFDGVIWFAIGSGRRVSATSSKLLLAINGTFGDIADSGTSIVSVIEDQGLDQASEYDYDPTLTVTDARYNKGASCQAYHQCEKDYDCITKLGWEYMCADIADYRTYVPKFNITGDEIVSQQRLVTFSDVIYGNLPGGSTKRCVYRGSGAPCKKDFTSIKSAKNKKMFACAPNFYCADVENASEFNGLIARDAQFVDSFLFGHEGDFFGRQKDYANASLSLPAVAITNINYNSALISSNAPTDDFGICRPGKKIDTTVQIDQHSSRDTAHRTDYINQIASCDSTQTGTARIQSCPIFDDALKTSTGAVNTNYGNYLTPTISTTTPEATALVLALASNQNMCGAESLSGTGTSLFSMIEGLTITSQGSTTSPTLVQDACLRRAGAICQTDLDCGPNQLHAEVANTYSSSSFGTLAEQEYWEEYLVCGQEKPIPAIRPTNTADYYNYDMTQNRCCRPVTGTLTMYTSANLADLIPDADSGTVTTLNVSTFSYVSPSNGARYSRYSILDSLTTAPITSGPAPYTAAPAITDGITPAQFQWKTFYETGKKSCCGGGWIRKFADGTHDWTKEPEKLVIDVSNFRCLNYMQSTAFNDKGSAGVEDYVYMNYYNFAQGQNRLCVHHNGKGCVQTEFVTETGTYPIQPPQNITPSVAGLADILTDQGGGVYTARIDMNVDQTSNQYNVNEYVPYMPQFYNNMTIYYLDYDYTELFMQSDGKDRVSIILPAYVNANTTNYSNIKDVSLDVRKADGSSAGINIVMGYRTCDSDLDNNGVPDMTPFVGAPAAGTGWWCLEDVKSSATGRVFTVMHFMINDDDLPTGSGATCSSGCTAGPRIDFVPFNVSGHTYNGILADNPGQGLVPGNDNYYLTKLGRLELLGVPQIFYEPLYCNYDRRFLVNGIFKDLDSSSKDPLKLNPLASQFLAEPEVFTYNDTFNYAGSRSLVEIYGAPTFVDNAVTGAEATDVVYQNKIQLPQIFSGQEFLCCAKLGSTTSDVSKCCSGYGTGADGVYTCQLPSRVDLHVYFNKFISGEGIGDTLPAGGLLETDFIPETGEPKLKDDVYQKLTELGNAYCSSGSVRRGAAFGYFTPQPNPGYVDPNATQVDDDGLYYSIIDSVYDLGQNQSDEEAGYAKFRSGFRWNHHLYCDD